MPWLAREQLTVDGPDLVWQRVDTRCMHGEAWIEQVRHANTIRLGGQPKQTSVAIEAPGRAGRRHFQALLALAISQRGAQCTGAIFDFRVHFTFV